VLHGCVRGRCTCQLDIMPSFLPKSSLDSIGSDRTIQWRGEGGGGGLVDGKGPGGLERRWPRSKRTALAAAVYAAAEVVMVLSGTGAAH